LFFQSEAGGNSHGFRPHVPANCGVLPINCRNEKGGENSYFGGQTCNRLIINIIKLAVSSGTPWAKYHSGNTLYAMNNKLLKPFLIIMGTSLLLTGCVVHDYSSEPPSATADTTAEVDVSGPPPADQETDVAVGVAPGPDFVWVGGFWGWGTGGWAWHRGYWGRPPHRGAAWVRPHYVNRGGRHVWVRGGWR
jgi:hypothetical protein